MSEQQHRVGLRALETIGHIAPLDGLQTLVKAASEDFQVYVIPYQSIEALGEQAEGGDLEDAALLWCQGPEMADRRPLDLRGLAESVVAGRVEAMLSSGNRWTFRLPVEVDRALSRAVEAWPDDFAALLHVEVDLDLLRAVETWPDDFAALIREVHRGSP